MNLTIAYLTSREDCRFEWFADSLKLQTDGDLWAENISVVVVDYWSQSATRQTDLASCMKFKKMNSNSFMVTPPKPTVWQGPHRLTQNNYFAPSNARNTALCYAPDGWIAYVDDLSVLHPGWLSAVREAMAGNYIACGAFRKVNKLVVSKGVIESFEDHPAGIDSRWGDGEGFAVDCAPNWLFGCSVAMPVDALLKINGWPEAVCDSTGVGAEDCFTGMALAATGHALKYNRRMLTYESEELHHQLPAMKRIDKGDIGTPNSKSHAAVRMLRDVKYFDNDFSPFPDIAALRQHVLSGGEFPIPKNPQHDWYDGQKLSEL